MMLIRGLKWSKYYFRQVLPSYFQNRNFKVGEVSTFQGLNSSISSLCTSMKNDSSFEHIVWLDMEMTGLDINEHQILEIACVITNNDLEEVGEPLNIVIHHSNEILCNMNEWSTITHRQTGLTNESRMSKVTLKDATEMLLNYLKTHVEEHKCPLAGNSIYMDHMFLQKYMSAVKSYLHYRTIDVSTIKELITAWNINIPQVHKMHVHRALPDIKESIAELQHYKKYIFNPHIRCDDKYLCAQNETQSGNNE